VSNIVLKSSRILLKELSIDDVSSEYVNWMNDTRVNKHLESRFIDHGLEDIKNFVHKTSIDKNSFLFGIFYNNIHIGNIKLGPVDRNHNRASIGLLIGDKKSWGKGFAAESINLITNYGFNDLGLEKIFASCYENNLASRFAFEKAGYEVEGFFTNYVNSSIGREGVWWMGISSNRLKDED
jgi:[ribosomal protein S5]-alanine N-acetyltransferase